MTRLEIIEEMNKLSEEERQSVIEKFSHLGANDNDTPISENTNIIQAVFVKGDFLKKAERFAKTPINAKKFDKLCQDIEELWGDQNMNTSLSQEEIDANCF